MKCVWLESGAFSLRDIDREEIGVKSALIKIHRAGICSTDLQLQNGYYPFTGVAGHEFVGSVAECVVSPNLIGRRVVADINLICHECANCDLGLAHHCSNRTVLGIISKNGCFAEFISLPVENLVVVPDLLPDRLACFAEPVAAALEIQEQLRIKSSDRVLIIGDGKLALLIARTLEPIGCQLKIFGHHIEKLKLLSDTNVELITDPAKCTENSNDIVIECAGHPSAFEQALKCARPRGSIVLKSTYAGQLHAKISEIVVKELTLIGSRCGPIAKAVNWLMDCSNHEFLTNMITAEYQLKDALRAIEHAKKRESLKVQIICHSSDNKS